MTTMAAPTPAEIKAQVKQDWIAFFTAATPAAKRVSLLENGSKFASTLEADAANPLAKNSGVTVKSITLQGPASARVVYTVTLGGKPAPIPAQTGTAILKGGSWEVSTQSFCGLLGLEGQLPPSCPKG
jgi:glycine cleavage system aminomethyltransferase T